MKEERYVEKIDRVMLIYLRLLRGDVVRKKSLAREFNVTERSIQRDLGALRCFLAEQTMDQDVVYDPAQRGYRLRDAGTRVLTNGEVLAVCTVLLDSRPMRRDELFPILRRLIERCVPEHDRQVVEEIVAGEERHYVEPRRGEPVTERIWELERAIRDRSVLELSYRPSGADVERRRVLPVAILFHEAFFLTAFDEETYHPETGTVCPAMYQLDRIRSVRVTDARFEPPYRSQLEEEEFRRRAMLPPGGALERMRFKYTGTALEHVLDHLPTARIVERTDDGWILEADMYGSGGADWARGQGAHLQML